MNYETVRCVKEKNNCRWCSLESNESKQVDLWWKGLDLLPAWTWNTSGFRIFFFFFALWMKHIIKAVHQCENIHCRSWTNSWAFYIFLFIYSINKLSYYSRISKHDFFPVERLIKVSLCNISLHQRKKTFTKIYNLHMLISVRSCLRIDCIITIHISKHGLI